MSNVAVFNPSQVPAFAKKRGELSAVAKALAGGGAGGGGKNISIKGGVFRLIASGKEVALGRVGRGRRGARVAP